VRVEGDDVLVEVPPVAEFASCLKRPAIPSRVAVSDPTRVVIIGGGPAAVAAAQTLRTEGFLGAVTILSAEAVLPYDRIKVSKQPKLTAAALALKPAEFYEHAAIDV
jgi:hypothetical protein